MKREKRKGRPRFSENGVRVARSVTVSPELDKLVKAKMLELKTMNYSEALNCVVMGVKR